MLHFNITRFNHITILKRLHFLRSTSFNMICGYYFTSYNCRDEVIYQFRRKCTQLLDMVGINPFIKMVVNFHGFYLITCNFHGTKGIFFLFFLLRIDEMITSHSELVLMHTVFHQRIRK